MASAPLPEAEEARVVAVAKVLSSLVAIAIGQIAIRLMSVLRRPLMCEVKLLNAKLIAPGIPRKGVRSVMLQVIGISTIPWVLRMHMAAAISPLPRVEVENLAAEGVRVGRLSPTPNASPLLRQIRTSNVLPAETANSC